VKIWLTRGISICGGLSGFVLLYALAARAGQISYATTLAAAQAAQQQALEQECAWSVTGPAIEAAQKLHQQGKDDAAATAAAHAEDLAEQSLKQCEAQKQNWKKAVVR